jgi:hypothetical protein
LTYPSVEFPRKLNRTIHAVARSKNVQAWGTLRHAAANSSLKLPDFLGPDWGVFVADSIVRIVGHHYRTIAQLKLVQFTG